VDNKLDQLIEDIKEEIGLLLSVSFGIFLFILFFQPFPLIGLDFNNTLLFVGGLSTIVFLIMVLIRIAIPRILRKNSEQSTMLLLPSYLNGFIILILNSVAFVFYIRYVGLVSITFFITFKAVLICLAPPFILSVFDSMNELRQQNEMLIVERKIIQKQIEKYEEDLLNKTIEFNSENGSDGLNLLIAEVVMIRSADNYVEVVYKLGDVFKKKLIRNTLKNIELQVKQYSNFIRCHRICIVNLHYIERLATSNNNHWLIIKGFDEQVPVSRQYLLKLKEAL
jgi:DNA-binding LytR/AlgR family response regulator